MWLFSTLGFFSVVAHRDHPDALIVRARVRGDLESLRDELLPDLELEELETADYRFRAHLSRDEWAHAAERLAASVDYDNFKDAVARRQGDDRAHRYLQVWSVMRELQEG